MRWTETHAEERKIAGFPDFVSTYVTKPLRLQLTNGRILTGSFFRSQSGNNAGEGGWSYYAEITLETHAGEIDIDYLDIEFADFADVNRD